MGRLLQTAGEGLKKDSIRQGCDLGAGSRRMPGACQARGERLAQKGERTQHAERQPGSSQLEQRVCEGEW